MVDAAKIRDVQRKIVDLLFDECTNGQQSLDLPNGVLACGQFVGADARQLRQRGIHGTAAAIRVLGDAQSEEAISAIPKLAAYVDDRAAAEAHVTGSLEPFLAAKIERDEVNVIKTSEVLYALQCVNPSTFDVGPHSKQLAKRLLQARVQNGRGWTFFMDDTNNEAELIPTAHAVIALSKYGVADIIRTIDFLVDAVDGSLSDSESSPSAQDYSVYILALFAITFHDISLDGKRKAVCQKALKHYWSLTRPLFEHDLEQNIEYWHNGANVYIRIPWQLYLIAVSARLSPLRVFSSSVVQDKLALICESLGRTGYKYPHSGQFVSSRTSAILYDVNEKILAETSKEILQRVWNVADRVRGIFSTRTFIILARVGAGVISAYAVYRWAKSGRGEWDDLAPEVIGAALLFLVSLGRKR